MNFEQLNGCLLEQLEFGKNVILSFPHSSTSSATGRRMKNLFFPAGDFSSLSGTRDKLGLTPLLKICQITVK